MAAADCAACAKQVQLTAFGRCPVCGATIDVRQAAPRVRGPTPIGEEPSAGRAGCSLAVGVVLLVVAVKTGFGSGQPSLGQVPAGVTSPLLFLLGATAALGAWVFLAGGLFGLLAAWLGPLPGRLRLPSPDPGSPAPGRAPLAGCAAGALGLLLAPLLLAGPCLLAAWAARAGPGLAWTDLATGLRRTHLLGPIFALTAVGLCVRLARLALSAERRVGGFAPLTIGLAVGLSAAGAALAVGLPGWLGLGEGRPSGAELLLALFALALASTGSRWALFGPLDARATPAHMPHAFESALLFSEEVHAPYWGGGEVVAGLVIASILLPGAALSLAIDRLLAVWRADARG